MKSNNKSKEFKDLQDKWYGKLEKDGFVDIEEDEDNLKIWHSFFLSRSAAREVASVRQQKEEYYRLAGHFLYDHKFESALDRRIWELHSQGNSARTIVKILDKEKHRLDKSSVHRNIQALAREMINVNRQK